MLWRLSEYVTTFSSCDSFLISIQICVAMSLFVGPKTFTSTYEPQPIRLRQMLLDQSVKIFNDSLRSPDLSKITFLRLNRLVFVMSNSWVDLFFDILNIMCYLLLLNMFWWVKTKFCKQMFQTNSYIIFHFESM